jgi:cell division septation protein DedD
MTDEGFREIQLDGKQLVFLFMAATVVSVVVFLLGVMVGRNVRLPAPAIAAASTDPSVDPTVDPTADPTDTAPTVTGAGTTERIPLSAQETLTYAERLEAPEPVRESLDNPTAAIARTPERRSEPRPETVSEERAASAPKAPATVSARAPARTPEPAVQNARFTEPPGNGYVVQVLAAVKREEAESLARRLTAKGYPTFVSVGDAKVPAKFRVRVGKYSDKREADAIFRRLEQEERFKPWLTR